MAPHYFFMSALVALVALQGICAVRYEVINTTPTTPGGIRFDREIGIPFTKQILRPITKFIWKIFREQTLADRKNIKRVTVVVAEYTGPLAYLNIYTNTINVSAPFLQNAQGDIKLAFTALMYHEMTHVFQWSGNYTAPGGLTEGIADYMVLKANYFEQRTYTKFGEGDRWDQGYGVTARFLEYCDGLRRGFVAALNKKMRYAWNDKYFVQLLGKPVHQLWMEYKTKYGRFSLSHTHNVIRL